MSLATFWQQKIRQPQKYETKRKNIYDNNYLKPTKKGHINGVRTREGGRTVGSGRVATIIE